MGIDVLGAEYPYNKSESALILTPTDITPIGASSVSGPYTVTTPPGISDTGMGLLDHFYGDYYYRIWVIPAVLVKNNARVGTPYEFQIWNAFPYSHTMSSITESEATGLTLNITPPDVYKEVELKTQTVTIGTTAPFTIDADYEFNFADAVGYFTFQATTADFVVGIPDAPVQERWEWLTNIMKSWDGTEQRASLRLQPRRTLLYSRLLDDEDARRLHYEHFYKNINGRIIIPYYQYATVLTQDSLLGTNRVYFDPAKTDVREDEYIVITDPATEAGVLAFIDTLEVDGATLLDNLEQDVNTGDLVAPSLPSLYPDGTGLGMIQLSGDYTLTSRTFGDRETSFERPGSAAWPAIFEYDSMKVLTERPLVRDRITEQFIGGKVMARNDVGVLDFTDRWLRPDVAGERLYLIQRTTDYTKLDRWRTFFEETYGQREPFLLPTFRPDLTLAEAVVQNSSTITINEQDYENRYFPYDTYKRIQLMAANDLTTVWRTVVNVIQSGSDLILTFDEPLPDSTLFAGSDLTLSFLNKVRLNSDTVDLVHWQTHSLLRFSVRNIDG